jgi:hypothetical protein
VRIGHASFSVGNRLEYVAACPHPEVLVQGTCNMRLLRNLTQSDPYGATGWLLVASGGLLFAAEDAQPLGPVFTARRCAWEKYADTPPGSVPSGNSTASDYWREVQVSALCCQAAP